ncbi:hypothetical protein [uncultured Paraglaciecola sp.]|uniref:hypothetical protein n=1 Tax=uncultured Paraglaciecola sp. TaxID=1765024 RepID=UPI0026204A83|nr:hypothetical protein [uncultured Paraglaciecola sp.]
MRSKTHGLEGDGVESLWRRSRKIASGATGSMGSLSGGTGTGVNVLDVTCENVTASGVIGVVGAWTSS